MWIVLALGAVWLARAIFPGSQPPPTQSTPHELSAGEILKQRYARGEITKDQYDEMRRDLQA